MEYEYAKQNYPPSYPTFASYMASALWIHFRIETGAKTATIFDVGKRCRIGRQKLRSEQHIVAALRRKKLRPTNRRSATKTPLQQRGACFYRRFLVSVITLLKVRCRFAGTIVGTTPFWISRNSMRTNWLQNRSSGLRNRRTYGGVTAEFLCDATHRGTPLYRAIDEVLKGKEVSLPEGMSYHDKDGHERNAMRIKWFRSPANETYASYALTVDDGIPEDALPSSMLESVTPYPADANPVLFGHYWLRAEQPFRLEHNVACVDFSVAKGGSLCAYRWDGESKLSNDKFVSVQAK